MIHQCSECHKKFESEETFDAHPCSVLAEEVAARMFSNNKRPSYEEFLVECDKEKRNSKTL